MLDKRRMGRRKAPGTLMDPWPTGYGIGLNIEGFRVQSLCEAFGVENC